MFAVFMPGPLELIIFGVIILLLFGSRLPGVMRSMGSSISEFKKGVRDNEDDPDSKKP
jgi:sec-independent protein translocase protein TatA